MKKYCKYRDILIERSEYNRCEICGGFEYCETSTIIKTTCIGKTTLDQLTLDNEHQRLVNEYLRKKKLERILE